MNVLDVRTIAFGYVLTASLCALLMVLLWLQNRRRFDGTTFWMVDFVLQPLAFVLILLRGTIPDWASMVLANALIMYGALLGFMGQERFLAKKGPQAQNYLLLGLFVFVQGYFTLIQPSLTARNLNIAVTLLLICAQSAWLMWYRVEPARRGLTLGVGAVNLLYCLLSAVRILHIVFGPQQENDYFKADAFESMLLLAYQVALIALTYSLLAMVNKRLVMQLSAQEEKFSKAFHNAPYAITLTRASDGLILDVNENFSSVTGYERAEVIGKKTTNLHLWERVEDRDSILDALSRTGAVRALEMQFRKKSGESVTGLFSAQVLQIDGEPRVLSCIGDITERKQMEEQVRRMAFHDTLTELPNRRLLEDRLRQALAASRRSGCYGALLFLDLDQFKCLNDTYGHAMGDLLLIEAAARLKNCVREMDTVARFGGDEFVVMISELSKDRPESAKQAGVVAMKISAALGEPFVLRLQHPGKEESTVQHQCTASIGVALFGKDDASQEDVLKWADAAMYRAKEAGGNLIRFHELSD